MKLCDNVTVLPVVTSLDLDVERVLQAAMEQEPVAWMVTYGGLINIVYTQPTQVVDTHYQPLYASPPHRKQSRNIHLRGIE